MAGTEEIAPALALAGAGLLLASGAVELGGLFPRPARPPALSGPTGALLAWLLLAAVAALLAAALLFALARLSWPAAVIAGGLGLLAGPPLWNLLPRRLLERPAGLALALLALAAAALLLLRGGGHV